MLNPGSGLSSTPTRDASTSASPVIQAGRRVVPRRQGEQPQLVRQQQRHMRRRRVGGHLPVHQHAVAQREPVVDVGVGERHVEGEVEVPRRAGR